MATKWTLRTLRLSMKPPLSQREVARRLNLACGYYCDLENSKRVPSFRVARLLADFYQVKIDDIEFPDEEAAGAPAEGGR